MTNKDYYYKCILTEIYSKNNDILTSFAKKIMLQPIYLPEMLIFVFRNPKTMMNEYGTKTVPKLPNFL